MVPSDILAADIAESQAHEGQGEPQGEAGWVGEGSGGDHCGWVLK